MSQILATLGQAELEILQIVQEQQPVTVGELAQRVADDTGKARTTVATMVGRLLEKGYLARKKIDGKFHYTARVGKTELMSGLVKSFVETTLGGSVSPFVAYLAEQPNLSPAEIEHLQQLVRDLEPRGKGKRT
jgi:predicted transcriptional regulator